MGPPCLEISSPRVSYRLGKPSLREPRHSRRIHSRSRPSPVAVAPWWSLAQWLAPEATRSVATLGRAHTPADRQSTLRSVGRRRRSEKRRS